MELCSPFVVKKNALLAIRGEKNNNLMDEMSRRVKSDVFIQFARVCPHRVGHNEIIGVMRVGCHAEGLGRDHWNEMLAYPRKPIAHWHPLLESKKSEKEVGHFQSDSSVRQRSTEAAATMADSSGAPIEVVASKEKYGFSSLII